MTCLNILISKMIAFASSMVFISLRTVSSNTSSQDTPGLYRRIKKIDCVFVRLECTFSRVG